MVVALSRSTQLVGLFVILPVVVGLAVMALIAWRAPAPAPGTRTSELLERGEPAEAEVVSQRTLGGFLDPRPMVEFLLRVRPAAAAEFALTVVQPMPRRQLADLRPGTLVTVRLSPDGTAGAIVVGGGAPSGGDGQLG